MSSMTNAYITGVGAYLPGEPVDNEQLAAWFGDGTRREAAVRGRVASEYQCSAALLVGMSRGADVRGRLR